MSANLLSVANGDSLAALGSLGLIDETEKGKQWSQVCRPRPDMDFLGGFLMAGHRMTDSEAASVGSDGCLTDEQFSPMEEETPASGFAPSKFIMPQECGAYLDTKTADEEWQGRIFVVEDVLSTLND